MTASSNKSPPRLSVAMIVRNEQEVLPSSIVSVQAIADEIVILDTGSQDRTVDLAEELGARVEQMPWNDDFAAARNRCRLMATGDWILWLNAGERIDAASAEQLRGFVDGEAEPGKAYMLLVEVPPAEPGASGERTAQLRLMPNRPELSFDGRVGESMQAAIDTMGLEIGAIAARIIRHPRQHDPIRKAELAQRNLKLVELEAAEKGDALPARLLLVAGEAHADLGAVADAQMAFREALEKAEHGSSEMLEAYYGLLTTCDPAADGDLQMKTCVEALEIYPLDAQLLLVMGNCLQAKERLDLAARSFQIAVEHGQVDPCVWYLSEVQEVAASCLGSLFQLQDKGDEACRVLEEALRRNEGSQRLRRQLINLLARGGRPDEAIEVAAGLGLPPEQFEPFCSAVRGACRAAAQEWTAAMGFLQSAYAAGCRDPFCLRWLAVTLLSNAQLEAAVPVLEEWRRLEPGNAELQAYLAAVEQTDTEPTGRQFRLDRGVGFPGPAAGQLPVVGRDSTADL